MSEILPDTESEDADDDDTFDADYQPESSSTAQYANMVNLAFPRKVMECDEICNTADRLALTDNQVTAMVPAVLKAGGADLNSFVISYSTTHRQRMVSRCAISESYMEAFRQNPPQHVTLHWDGKMMKDVIGSEPGTSSETLAVLVSGASSYTEGKLLGIPVIANATGAVQAETTFELLNAWDLTDNVTSLVFDTTASNSGVHKGAAKLLEDKLQRKVFYLACRHHILEIVIGGVWEKVFGKVKSPDNPWFQKLRDTWPDIDKEKYKTISTTNEWLIELEKQSEEILEKVLSSDNIPRADYREVAELAIIVLGKTPPRGIHWSRPGAIHQARWMARNIYAMKMFLFSDAMNYDVVTQMKLERLNTFLALFYSPRWMNAQSAPDAPLNDLSFFKDMIRYKEVDPEIAAAVLSKLANHKWYLTQEVVVFALFSNNVSNDTKQSIAMRLSSCEKPQCFRKGKPLFPAIQEETTLADLVGPESYLLFETLAISTDWLSEPVLSWPAMEDFQVADTYVKSLKVVNDIAERGVKMMSDYANKITTDNNQRQHLLQAVEYHRHRFTSFKKDCLNQ